MLESACKEFTNQHSAIASDPKVRFGPEWVAKKQGPKEILGLEELWVPRPAPTEGWTKLDWNVYVVALEIEVRRTNAPEIHLINAWSDFSDLLQQPEPGQPIRLTHEWAKQIASVTWVWLYSTDQYPIRNQTRVSCKWCKQNSIVLIEITSRAVTPMGQLIAGPYGTRVRLDNGFVGLPANSQLPATTIAEQINPSLIDQMCPRGSLPIQTRDAVFGILHTRSVYSDSVPRILPGIRERTMVAGGSIEWESIQNHLRDQSPTFPSPNHLHLTRKT